MVYYSPARYNEVMFLVGLFHWWYGNGLRDRFRTTGQRVRSIAEYFSIGQLLKTLFAPFRQISAGKASGSVGAQLRGIVDSLISRIIGGVVRFGTIVVGLIIIMFVTVYESILLVCWPLVPVFIFASAVLAAIGWTL